MLHCHVITKTGQETKGLSDNQMLVSNNTRKCAFIFFYDLFHYRQTSELIFLVVYICRRESQIFVETFLSKGQLHTFKNQSLSCPILI